MAGNYLNNKKYVITDGSNLKGEKREKDLIRPYKCYDSYQLEM